MFISLAQLLSIRLLVRMLSKNVNSDQLCFILKETIYPHLVWDWLYIFVCNLIILNYVLVTALLLKYSVLLYKWRLNLVSFMYILKLWWIFGLFSVNVVYHIHWCMYIEPSWNARNESHFVRCVSHQCYWVCFVGNLLRIFASIIIRDLDL